MHCRSDKALDDLARMFNPYIQGWINYYSHLYRSALYWTLSRVDAALVRWACDKFKAFAKAQGAQGTGWHEFVGQIQTSSRIGALCVSTTEHREPYDPRGSRTALGARGGAIPLRDSPSPRLDRGREALALARRRSEWLRSRCPGSAPQRHPRGAKAHEEVLEIGGHATARHDHGQTPFLWRRENEDGPCRGTSPA